MGSSVRRRAVHGLTVIAALGCRQAAPPDVEPVTVAQATEFARAFADAALPCDRGKLDPLFDASAFGARFRHGESTPAIEGTARAIERTTAGPATICGWQAGVESYQLLRVRSVDGQPRPLFRRILRDARTGMRVVGYDDVMLGAARGDHQVRAIDIFQYAQGQWLSEILRSMTDATVEASSEPSQAQAINDRVERAHRLGQAGQPREALAEIDALPAAVHRTRGIQTMRVAIANAISQDAHKQALDELAATFPDDPSVALLQVNGAVLRKDYDAALHCLDQIDHAIGGDAWQDAVRAEVLLLRGGRGDLEAAQARADAAIRDEPGLVKGWWARLDVALTQNRWATALATMDELHDRFQVEFSDEAMHKLAIYRGLLETPAYAAWRARVR